MILSATEIEKQVALGRIHISPYDASQLNPVSYNYRLGNNILEVPLNNGEHKDAATLGSNSEAVEIPKEGFLMRPDKLYLGNTNEEIGSRYYVVSLFGRSSIGRLGLFVQISADLGNLGAIHRWTLELHCVQPVRIYAGMTIGQVCFWKPFGARTYYKGVYSIHSDPMTNLHNRLER